MIKIGDEVADQATGYEGIVTQRIEKWGGEVSCCVEHLDSNGKVMEHWFIESRLSLNGNKKVGFR